MVELVQQSGMAVVDELITFPVTISGGNALGTLTILVFVESTSSSIEVTVRIHQ